MKIGLFYFTGTGNSLFSAKKLAKHLNGEVELISIPKMINNKERVFNYKKIGFVFPLYFIGVPEIVERFINESNFNNVEYCFSLTTAGMTPGMTGVQIEKLLQKKNIQLNNNKWIYFTSNYIRKLKIASKSTISKKIMKNNIILKKYSDEINKNKSKRIQPMNVMKLLGYKLYKEWRVSLISKTEDFYINDKCKNCSVCELVCPENNIHTIDSKITWGNKCQDCVSCIHNCPNGAIQIKGISKNHGRYRNPEIPLGEIINANK